MDGDRKDEEKQKPRHESRIRRAARWLPAALIVAGAAFYWFSPPGLTSSPFYQSAPLIAAALLSMRATVATAVVALLTNIGLEYANGTEDKSESIIEMISQFVVGCLAVGINVLVGRNDRRLASARHISLAAQRAVLPTPPEGIGSLRIAARYRAADADARIGGDIYAVQNGPYGIRLIVGDVRGKGLEAVETVAVVIGAFREAAEQEQRLDGVAWRLEHALQREGVRAEGLERIEGFVTATLAEVAGDRGTVRIVNRGHPAPLMLLRDGTVHCLEPEVAALPLGMGDLGTWPDEVLEVPFPQGACLLLFTDGVTEARDADGVFYDPETRVRGRIFASPEKVVNAVIQDVTRHTGGRIADDMALLAVTREPWHPAYPEQPGQPGQADHPMHAA